MPDAVQPRAPRIRTAGLRTRFLLAMVAVAFLLGGGTALLGVYQLRKAGEAEARELAANLRGAPDAANGAEALLARARTWPRVLAAGIYDKAGRLLEVAVDSPAAGDRALLAVPGRHWDVSTPTADGRQLRLIIDSSTTQAHERRLIALAAAWLLAVTLAAAAALRFGFGRRIAAVDDDLRRAHAIVARHARPSATTSKDASLVEAIEQIVSRLERRERELADSRRRAAAASQLKDQLSGTLCEEVRKPLHQLIERLEVLSRAKLPGTAGPVAAVARASSQSLLARVDDMLDVCQLESGHVVLDPQPLDLRQLVEDVVDEISPQAYGRGLELGHLIAPGFASGWIGDGARLRQLLSRLLGHAIAATRHGEIALQMSVDNEPRTAAPTVRIGVHASGELATVGGEEGLGLLLCRQLVALMEGEFEADDGDGLNFRLRLPLAPDHDITQLVTPGVAQGMAVLVVELSQVGRTHLRAELVAEEATATLCASADEAMAAIRAARQQGRVFALALVDAALPPDRLAQLRRAAGADVRSWVLTRPLNRGREDDPGDWWAQLAKPFRRARLQGLLRQLGDIAARDVVPAAPPPMPRVNARVLVVDDHRTNQVIVRGMLELLGATVELADGAVAALAAHGGSRYDLILLDCRMPMMDGYDTCRAIREREAIVGGRTPIVGMDSEASPEDLERGRAAGMDGRILKPFTMETLADTLQQWVDVVPLPEALPTDSTGVMLQAGEGIDGIALQRLSEAIGDCLGQIIEPFLEDMPALLRELMRGAAEDDTDGLRMYAQRIRGAAGNLGAYLLARSAEQLEQRAINGGDCIAQVDSVTAEFERVAGALSRLMRGHPTQPPTVSIDGGRVLVVDDDRSTRTALRLALTLEGFRVVEAEDGGAALARALAEPPELVLLDAGMPAPDGFETCRRLRLLAGCKEVPVLMLTAIDDRHAIASAFAAGASDFLTTPLHLDLVVQRVRHTIDTCRAEHHVRHLAYSDALTGLPNRRHFQERFEQQIAIAQRENGSLALMFLDLNRFKVVNDTLGHDVGDLLLQAVAGRLGHSVRGSDNIARLGGDEFTVVLESPASTAVITAVAGKIAEELSQPYQIDGHDISVSPSIGIALFPTDGDDPARLMRHADAAMYRAKKSGRPFLFHGDANAADVS